MGDCFKVQRGSNKKQSKYLYKAGDEYAALTGGWSVTATRSTYTATPTITKNAGNIQFKCQGLISSNGEMSLTHVNPIDVTGYKTLHVKCNVQYAHDKLKIGIDNVKDSGALETTTPTSLMTAYVSSSVTANTEIILDISALTGNQFIYLIFTEVYSGGNMLASAYFYEVWLES